MYNQSVGRVLGGSKAVEESFLDEAGENALNVNMGQEEQQDGAIEAAVAHNANGETRKRRAGHQKR